MLYDLLTLWPPFSDTSVGYGGPLSFLDALQRRFRATTALTRAFPKGMALDKAGMQVPFAPYLIISMPPETRSETFSDLLAANANPQFRVYGPTPEATAALVGLIKTPGVFYRATFEWADGWCTPLDNSGYRGQRSTTLAADGSVVWCEQVEFGCETLKAR